MKIFTIAMLGAMAAPAFAEDCDDLTRLLTSANQWPLIGTPRRVPYTNHQLDLNQRPQEVMHHFAETFAFDLHGAFALDASKFGEVDHQNSGLTYLLLNAFYLYSGEEFRTLAGGLTYPAAAGVLKSTFSKGVKYFNGARRDTQAALLEGDDFALLIFQGSSTIKDWANNLGMLAVRPYPERRDIYFHRGFYKGLEEIAPELLSALASLNGKKLLVAGHSLGGALAQLFYARSALEPNFLPAGVTVDAVYTWASPRITSPSGARVVHDEIVRSGIPYFRFTAEYDVVPHLPPRALGFASVAPAYFYNAGRWLRPRTGDLDFDFHRDTPYSLSDAGDEHVGRSYWRFHRSGF